MGYLNIDVYKKKSSNLKSSANCYITKSKIQPRYKEMGIMALLNIEAYETVFSNENVGRKVTRYKIEENMYNFWLKFLF